MKSIVSAVVVGLFLFAASAGLSWWLIYTPPAAEDADAVAEVTEEFPIDVPEDEKQDQMPVAVRPEMPISMETVTGLAETIMKKEQKVFEAEQALRKEEHRIQMLFEDLKREQEELQSFADKVDSMILEAKEAIKLLELEKQAVSQKSAELSKLEKKLGVKQDELPDREMEERVKMAKTWLQKSDPAGSAEILQTLVEDGSMELAAKVLDSMDERQKAKIIDQIPDKKLVAELLISATGDKDVPVPTLFR